MEFRGLKFPAPSRPFTLIRFPVDMDPGASGVHDVPAVTVGNPFTVDIVPEGVGVIPPDGPLNAFDFDLVFSGSVVDTVDVVDERFLLAPVAELQKALGTNIVEFAELTRLPAGAVGDGVLATISFKATAAGAGELAVARHGSRGSGFLPSPEANIVAVSPAPQESVVLAANIHHLETTNAVIVQVSRRQLVA